MSKKLGILVLVIVIIVFGLNNFRELTVWILASLGKILLVAAVVIAIVDIVYYLFFGDKVESPKTPARMIALTGILVILWWFGISFFGFPMWIPVSVSVWGGLTVLVTAEMALKYRHDKVSLAKKERKEDDSEKRNDETEDEQNAERAKLLERYNAVMPRVKQYLDSVGFTLPENENLFFMEIDESNGKWKFQSYEEAVDDEFFKDTTYPRASGILLTPEMSGPPMKTFSAGIPKTETGLRIFTKQTPPSFPSIMFLPWEISQISCCAEIILQMNMST